MYGHSTKSDAEKHGCSGLTRIIPEGALLIRYNSPNSPNSRSILDLRKNDANAETCADDYAEHCADVRAEVRAEKMKKVLEPHVTSYFTMIVQE